MLRVACRLRKRPVWSAAYSTYAQGEGLLGCLGFGGFKAAPVCAGVPRLAAADVRKVAAGWGHSAAVTSDGDVFVSDS
jgi:alpha-tubulin suppressor-like RCC1 family protein